jgi:hypothetical protein
MCRVTVEQSLPGNLDPGDWALLREVIEADNGMKAISL